MSKLIYSLPFSLTEFYTICVFCSSNEHTHRHGCVRAVKLFRLIHSHNIIHIKINIGFFTANGTNGRFFGSDACVRTDLYVSQQEIPTKTTTMAHTACDHIEVLLRTEKSRRI